MKNIYVLVLMIFFSYSVYPEEHLSIKAFPSAEGFGANAKGGRGGVVFHVTNLNDAGDGSLRYCAEAKGPRTCIFRVGGVISLKSELKILNPYLTIAGQTAPGDGVLIRSAPTYSKRLISIRTHDVIIRFIRIRRGEPAGVYEGSGFSVWGGHDIILDHSSFGWNVDDNLGTYWWGPEQPKKVQGSHRITYQWNILSETLKLGKWLGYLNSHASLIGPHTTGISFHHNLIANVGNRAPLVSENVQADIVNNVIYNWIQDGTVFSAWGEWGWPTQANVVNNYYKRGPNTKTKGEVSFVKKFSGNSEFYISGNIRINYKSNKKQAIVISRPQFLTSTRVPFPKIKTESAEKAYHSVLAGAGAILPKRDSIDQRAVSSTTYNTGKVIDCVSASYASFCKNSNAGGWPVYTIGVPYSDSDKDGMDDVWEQRHGLDPSRPEDRNGDFTMNGYTNLEDYLNELAGDIDIATIK